MYLGTILMETDIDLTLSRSEFGLSYKNGSISAPLSRQSTAVLRARQGEKMFLFLLVGREARFD